ARHLARRIRRVVQAMRRSGLRYMKVHDAGLDHGDPILNVNREYSIHPLELDDDSTLNRQCTAAQTGSGTPRQERNPILIREAHDGSNFIRRQRKYNDVGFVFEKREAVTFIDEKFSLVFYDAARVQNSSQLLYEFAIHGFFCCSFSFW